jgi:alpha-tubulin suppressor-like RCC1 family protein
MRRFRLKPPYLAVWIVNNTNRIRLSCAPLIILVAGAMASPPAVNARAGAFGRVSVAHGKAGSLWVWGQNSYGQLGRSSSDDCSDASPPECSKTPILLAPPTRVVSAAGGGYGGIALGPGGRVWTWGLNWYGQLGNGTSSTCFACASVPKPVPGLRNIIAIASGGFFNLALTRDGHVWAWGVNQYGELGFPTSQTCQGGPLPWSCSTRPHKVAGLDHVVAIAAGDVHSLAVTTDGHVWAWGRNAFDELGTATTQMCDGQPCSPVPVELPGLHHIAAVAGETTNSLALSKSGRVWAWGDNSSGQLGNGTVRASRSPLEIRSLKSVVAIAGGSYYSLALTRHGNVYAWGRDNVGQLGAAVSTTCNGSPCSTRPIRVGPMANVVAIASQSDALHALALTKKGRVYAWGWNPWGQLGDGTTNDSMRPVMVKGLIHVSSVASGYLFSMAVATLRQ